MSRPQRLAVVTSHPIQYQAPWFRKLAAHPEVDLEVFFCCDHGHKPSYDPGFGETFAWSEPLTEGYRHSFLQSVHPKPYPNDFWSLANPALWRRLRREHFDAVLLVSWSFASAWLALATARTHGVRVLLRAESHLGSHHPRSDWKRVARHAGLTAFFSGVDAFLAIGARNAALYREFGIPESKIYFAPYAVDNDFFKARAVELVHQRTVLRAELDVTSDSTPVILSCGKLTSRKAPLDLLHAFARVRPHVMSKLVFLGDGPQRGDIETEARRLGVARDVVVTGFKQQDQLPRYYVAADLFVFPSQFETWGLVVNEAMLFGLPVICTDEVPAHDDLVIPGETGDVFPAGNVDRLAAILRQRLPDLERLHVMGRNARERVDRWDFDTCVEATVAALRNTSRQQ